GLPDAVGEPVVRVGVLPVLGDDLLEQANGGGIVRALDGLHAFGIVRVSAGARVAPLRVAVGENRSGRPDQRHHHQPRNRPRPPPHAPPPPPPHPPPPPSPPPPPPVHPPPSHPPPPIRSDPTTGQALLGYCPPAVDRGDGGGSSRGRRPRRSTSPSRSQKR